MFTHESKTTIGCYAFLICLILHTVWRQKTRSAGCLRRLVSGYLSVKAEQPALLPEVQRSQFNDLDLIQARPIPEHTHGVSAASRTTARNFCNRFAQSIGLRPFFFQTSRSNQRRGYEGSRIQFWGKDFNAQHDDSVPTTEHMVAMIDVDYYVDMASDLADNFQPAVLYTFQPDNAAATREDYSFTFRHDQSVDYVVNGGGRYRHPIWDFGVDCTRVTKTFLGIPYKTAIYLVDRRRVSPDHYLVSLTPVARWFGINAILSKFIGGNELTRFHPVDGQFTRIYVQGKNGLQVSTAEAGKYACGTIPAETDDAISILSGNQSVKLTQSAVLSHIPDGELIARRVSSAPILAYHLSKPNPRHRAYVFPVEDAVRSYQAVSELQDLEAKPTLISFMSPILHGAFAPKDTLANEQWCIKTRVTDLKPKTLHLTAYLDDTMREFARFLVPDANTLDPADLEEVYERQNRPTQQHILRSSENETPRRIFKSFMKRESNGNCKDPRNISTVNGPDKRDFSRFVYPISNLLKSAPWYAFGKTPIAISERVVEVLADAETAVNTDFSRFDGRISNLLRHLETIIYTRAYKTCYIPELLDLLRSQQNLKGKCRHGTTYNSGTSRGSGSPETSPNNTFDNAFVGYLALRSEPYQGRRRSPEEAWHALGIYGGDDGMTPEVSTDAYQRAAGQLGLKLECDQIQRGAFGITFLARIYGPDVWFGDTSSCCDIPRQLAKFHTTVNLGPGVTPVQKLSEKARSFFLTDENTPIIGALAAKVIELHGEAEFDERLRAMARWDTCGSKDVQYPNPFRDWMTSYSQNALSDFQFDHALFNEWLGNATIDTILAPPLCALPVEAKAKIAVHVDGVVVEPPAEKPAKPAHSKKSRTRKPKASAEGPAGKPGKTKELAPKKDRAPEKRPKRRAVPSK